MERLTKEEINAIAFILKKELDSKIDILNNNLSEEFAKSAKGKALQKTCERLKSLSKLQSEIAEEMHSLTESLREEYDYKGYDTDYEAIYKKVCPKVGYADLETVKKLTTYAGIMNTDIQFIKDYVRNTYHIMVKDKEKD